LFHAVIHFEAIILNRVLETLLVITITLLHGTQRLLALIFSDKRRTLIQYVSADSRLEVGPTAQIINMLLLFPRSPHESHFCEVLVVRLLPPGARLEHLLHDLEVVAPADIETLELDTRGGVVLLHMLH
jgi:hypothetical protein